MDFDRDACLSMSTFCDFSQVLCKLRVLLSGDFYPYYADGVSFSRGSDSVSLKDLRHMASNIRNGGFYRFPAEDGSVEPYNMSRITEVPVGLFVGHGDMMATLANGNWLAGVFSKNGNLGFYKRYNYLGHQTFFLHSGNRPHFADTVAYFLNRTLS